MVIRLELAHWEISIVSCWFKKYRWLPTRVRSKVFKSPFTVIVLPETETFFKYPHNPSSVHICIPTKLVQLEGTLALLNSNILELTEAKLYPEYPW